MPAVDPNAKKSWFGGKIALPTTLTPRFLNDC
jgi:hypothetical protein